MGTEDNRKEEKYLTALKMGLEVLIAVAFIGCIFWVVFFSIHFHEQEPQYTHDELIVGLVFAIIGIIFCVIGIIGIVKESKCIVGALLVMIIISMVANIYVGQYWTLVYDIIIAVLTIAFLYFIIQKERHSSQTVA